MENDYRFTVVIPHKNNSDTLSLAILSCIYQLTPPSRIIVIDDGSSPYHLTKAERIVKDLSYRLPLDLMHSPSCGIGNALNYGMSQVMTPYVARMDSDDVSLCWRFAHQLSLIKNNNLDIVGSSAIAVNSNLIPVGFLLMPSTLCAIKKRLVRRNAFIHPTIFGKASIFKSFPYSIDPADQGAEDLLLWRTLATHNIDMKNSVLPSLLYRLHERQYSRIRRLSNLKYLNQHK